MDHFHDKKLLALIHIMAREDPNNFIQKFYTAGLDETDEQDLFYLVRIARRAPGYEPEQDPFLSEGQG